LLQQTEILMLLQPRPKFHFTYDATIPSPHLFLPEENAAPFPPLAWIPSICNPVKEQGMQSNSRALCSTHQLHYTQFQGKHKHLKYCNII